MIDLNEFFKKSNLLKLNISEWGYTEELSPIHFEEYQKWISLNHHQPLTYLADERMNQRSNVRNYYPEAQSAIVLLFSYRSASEFLKNYYQSSNNNGLKIASYTLGFEGLDYHHVLREKLDLIAKELSNQLPNLEYKLSIDMHPVMERDLSLRAGIGWQGKNSMLITRKSGSFFIIASIILNQKLNNSDIKLEVDHCGQCTRCIDNCPTSAIDINNRTIIANKCISTFTIEEFKIDTKPVKEMDLNSGFIFGCDICQDVCPWNLRLSRIGLIGNFIPNLTQQKIIDFFLKESPQIVADKIQKLSNSEYKTFFLKTSFFRSGKRGVLKNLLFFLKNKKSI